MMMKEVEVGDEYDGKVVKTTTFGAFIELAKGTDGLLHISNVSPGERVETVEDVLNKGDEVNVRVVEVDRERGRIGLRLVARPGHRRQVASRSSRASAPAAVVAADGRPRDGGEQRPLDRGRAAATAAASAAPAARATAATATDASAGPCDRAEHRHHHAGLRRAGRHRARARACARWRSASGSRTGSAAEHDGEAGHLAPARAHAVPRHRELRLGGDRPDLRRDGRRDQRRHRQGGDLALHARARPPSRARVRRDGRHGLAARASASSRPSARSCSRRSRCTKTTPRTGSSTCSAGRSSARIRSGAPVIGTAEVVGAVTREQLAAFHAERYLPESDRDRRGRLGRPRRARRDGARRRGRPRARRGARTARGPQAGRAGRRSRTSRRACASWRKTPSSTTCASAGRGSRATTSAASRCACSKACSAARPPRACSRRCASAAAWPTRSSPSRTCTRTPARSGCTWARARRTSSEALAVVAAELRALRRGPGERGGADALAREPQGPRGARRWSRRARA